MLKKNLIFCNKFCTLIKILRRCYIPTKIYYLGPKKYTGLLRDVKTENPQKNL